MTEQKSLQDVDSDENNSEETIGKVQEEEESPVEGWKLQKLGDFLTFEYGNNLPEDDRNNGKIPVYGSNGQVDTHDEVYVDGEGIVVGRKGSIAEAEYSEQPFFPIDTTYYISEEETTERLRFLYYLLNHLQLDRLNAASAIPGLNRNDAYNVKALIPPKEEQEKIASVLYNVDRAIQKTEEIIEQTQRVKKGLIQDLVEEAVSEGEMKNLENFIEDIRYGTDNKSNKDGEGTPTLRIPNVVKKKLDITDLKYTPLSDEEKEKLKLEEGDILILRTNGNPDYVGRTIAFPEVDEDFVFASYLIRIRVDENKLNPRYLSKYLNSKHSREEMDGWIRTSAGNYNLGINAIEKFSIPVIDLNKQKKFVERIESAEEKIESVEKEKEQLQRIKKGLMQDLLTGEVRTNDKEIEVLEEVKA